MALPGVVTRFLREHQARLLRYVGVSAVGVVLGQAILQFFYTILGWEAGVANVAAVMVATGPAYLMNRYWVWGKTSRNSFRTEVLPFWSMALLGLILSTISVHYVEARWESPIAVSAASIGAFGVLWVAKYFILDGLMFGVDHHIEPGEETSVEPSIAG